MREDIKLILLKNLLEEVTKKYDYFIYQKDRILEETYKIAITDGLTGLYNRYYALERLEKEIERSLRENTVFNLIICDLDNFKSINDRYGHNKGDEVLRLIGEIFKNNFRSYDIPARLGGDEFIIISVGFSDKDLSLEKRIENITKSVENIFPEEYLSVSCGAMKFPADFQEFLDMDKEEMILHILAKVDAIMYENKRKKKLNI